jgi:hypothetical protein
LRHRSQSLLVDAGTGGRKDPRLLDLQVLRIEPGECCGQLPRGLIRRRDGRLARPTVVATRVPAGATATFSAHASVGLAGSLAGDAGAPLVHTPSTSAAGRYVLRKDDAGVLDLVGLVAFVGTLLGVAGHALARVVAHRRAGRTS